ncbi:MAG TPA: CopG family transcriptional regulator [Tepidiformaceae bacterium]|nr:CopG family transcriptional regulator [Tepidiformaceae bacterium]
MTTTTITLDEPTQRELERLAAARGVSTEEIIREAIEHLALEHSPSKRAATASPVPRSRFSVIDETQKQDDVAHRGTEEHQRRRKNRPLSIGIADSGDTDTSERMSDERPEPRTWP